LHPDLPDEDCEALLRQMRECLEGRGGEISARARAAALGQCYLGLNDTGRKRFLELLAGQFAVDRQALYAAAREIHEIDNLEHALKTEARLREILTPPRLNLLTQFNSLPEGVKFLVDLREDLMRYSQGNPLLQSLDDDLRALLTSWFDVGFLELTRITWDAPAALLEKLIAYEAVHEIRSWDDLKHRLSPDRRCYAFFHPRMPDEPLIFIEVALVSGMANSIQALLDQHMPTEDPRNMDTAIFYSISNTQKGLKGVNFGSFLVKRVVDRLVKELAGLKTFATLSPIPGFRRYLETVLPGREGELLSQAERKALAGVFAADSTKGNVRDLLTAPDWSRDKRVAQTLKGPLTRFCAFYLAHERRNGRALDRVAHFHLSNGARIERINWLADVSPKGMRHSAGLMVNYRYKLRDIEGNHEAYSSSGEAAASPSVRRLLRSVD
ncbi:MAG: malonyl-CoA decarboxylase, partial [Acidiferrobacterales bacterium]